MVVMSEKPIFAITLDINTRCNVEVAVGAHLDEVQAWFECTTTEDIHTEEFSDFSEKKLEHLLPNYRY